MSSEAASRIFLRPIANPFALGFTGLAGASIVLAGQQIGWIPLSESVQVAVIVVISATALQAVACVFGFLARDSVAATGMGLLAATWGIVGASRALSSPTAHSAAQGTFLFLAAVGMWLSASTAAQTKLLPAAVMALTGVRFFVDGLYETLGHPQIDTAAGAIGCLLSVVAVYAAFALELEGMAHHTVLPTFRRGRGLAALQPNLAQQVEEVAAEPGVRNQL